MSDAVVAFNYCGVGAVRIDERIYPCRRTRRRRLPLSIWQSWRPRRLPARHLHPLPFFSPSSLAAVSASVTACASAAAAARFCRCVKRIRRRLLLIALTLSLIPRPSPGVLGGALGVRGVHPPRLPPRPTRGSGGVPRGGSTSHVHDAGVRLLRESLRRRRRLLCLLAPLCLLALVLLLLPPALFLVRGLPIGAAARRPSWRASSPRGPRPGRGRASRTATRARGARTPPAG